MGKNITALTRTDQSKGVLVTTFHRRTQHWIERSHMRTATIASAAATALIVLSLLAVPAVANGAAYFDHEDVRVDSPLSVVYAPDSDTAAPAAPTTASIELTPLIAAWWSGGAAILAGAAIAVGASVRRQSRLAD